MHYFITGATGFVGGVVARMLVADGHRVTAIVRNLAKASALAAAGVALVAGDVTDRESMRAPMQGTDGVLHIAGWYKLGARDGRDGEAINVQGTRNVLELMRDLHIPRGVYTSSIAVNSDTHGRIVDESYHFRGKHLSFYDDTKARAHFDVADPLIAAGLPLVIVQPGLIYGPGDTSSVRTTFIQYLQRQLPVLPQRTAFCWSHVEDIARAHIDALHHGKPGNYIIAGPPHTLTEAMDLAASITGIPAPMLRLPPAALKFTAALVAPIENILPVPADYRSEYLRVTAGTTYLGDNSKAKRELGYNPRPLRDGLAQTLRHEMRLLGMEPRF